MLEDKDHEYVIVNLHQILHFLSAATEMLKKQDELERLTNSDKPIIDIDNAYFSVSCSEHMLQELLFKISIEEPF